MHREGIQEQDLPQILDFLQSAKNLEVEGIMSHLHSADADDHTIHEQVTVFKKMGKLLNDAGFSPKRKHIGASAGLLKLHDDYFTAFRP